MIWKLTNIILCLFIGLTQGCAVYTFSGASLPPEAKTFSLQFQSGTPRASLELLNNFQQQLADTLMQRTGLKQVDIQGDLRFSGAIKGFEWSSPLYRKTEEDDDNAQQEQLTIDVEVHYINPYNEETSFEKKRFSESAVGNRSNEHDLIAQILNQLTEAIFKDALATW